MSECYSNHHFHEPHAEPMRAEAHRDGDDGWVRIYIGGAVVVLFPSGPDALARARRIADAINEGGRADAAPVE